MAPFRVLTPACLAVMLATPLTACFAVGDLDRFHRAGERGASENGARPNEDLVVAMTRMTPHVKQYMEVRVVSSSNFISSRAIIDVAPAQDIRLVMPQAIPNAANVPYRIDFFADMNNDRKFDLNATGERDHSWRVFLDDRALDPRVTHLGGLYRLDFLHNTDFTDLATAADGKNGPALAVGNAARFTIKKLSRGHLTEIRVTELPPSNHLVGLYRLYPSSDGDQNVEIPGCVERLVDYDVTLYVDANGNGVYDNPAAGGDLGFRYQVAAPDGTTGIAFTFDTEKTQEANVDVGSPF